MTVISLDEWYAIGLATVAVIGVVRRATSTLTRLGQFISYLLRKYFCYPLIWRRRIQGDVSRKLPTCDMTRAQFITLLMFWSVNGFCLGFRAHDTSTLSARSARLATINLAPVLIGTRLSDLTLFIGVSYRSAIFIHRWTSYTALIMALIHIYVSWRYSPLKWNHQVLAGTIAIGSSAAAAVSIQLCLRHLFFEFLLRAHIFLAAAGIATVYLHVASQPFESRLYIFVGICLWVLTVLLRLLLETAWNVNLGNEHWLPGLRVSRTFLARKPLELESEEREMHGAVHVQIRRKGTISVLPGQYVYVRVSHLGFRSVLQSHPFYIVSWDNDGDFQCLYLLVQQQRGLSGRLARCADRERSLTAWISGAYGGYGGLGEFGTVLMFATGIGIAAHLSGLKYLQEGRKHAAVKTHKVHLVWQIKDESHYNWAKKWLDALLMDDKFLTISIEIYVPEGEHKGDFPAGNHGMVWLRTRELDMRKLLGEFIGLQDRGHLLVSDTSTRGSLRDLVRSHMDKDVWFHEHDYRPPGRSPREIVED